MACCPETYTLCAPDGTVVLVVLDLDAGSATYVDAVTLAPWAGDSTTLAACGGSDEPDYAESGTAAPPAGGPTDTEVDTYIQVDAGGNVVSSSTWTDTDGDGVGDQWITTPAPCPCPVDVNGVPIPVDPNGAPIIVGVVYSDGNGGFINAALDPDGNYVVCPCPVDENGVPYPVNASGQPIIPQDTTVEITSIAITNTVVNADGSTSVTYTFTEEDDGDADPASHDLVIDFPAGVDVPGVVYPDGTAVPTDANGDYIVCPCPVFPDGTPVPVDASGAPIVCPCPVFEDPANPGTYLPFPTDPTGAPIIPASCCPVDATGAPWPITDNTFVLTQTVTYQAGDTLSYDVTLPDGTTLVAGTPVPDDVTFINEENADGSLVSEAVTCCGGGGGATLTDLGDGTGNYVGENAAGDPVACAVPLQKLVNFCDGADLAKGDVLEVLTKQSLIDNGYGLTLPWVDSGDGCTPADPPCPEIAATTQNRQGEYFEWSPGGPWVEREDREVKSFGSSQQPVISSILNASQPGTEIIFAETCSSVTNTDLCRECFPFHHFHVSSVVFQNMPSGWEFNINAEMSEDGGVTWTAFANDSVYTVDNSEPRNYYVLTGAEDTKLRNPIAPGATDTICTRVRISDYESRGNNVPFARVLGQSARIDCHFN